MKNEASYAKKIAPLIKKVRKAFAATGDELPHAGLDPVIQLTISFLHWNAPALAAEAAHARVMTQMVDVNDLRVTPIDDLIGLIGEDFPDVHHRVGRLLDGLQEIYLREHGMTMASQEGKNKKDVRHYLDSLPGMAPYVASEVMLLSFGAHAMPVDDRLTQRLIAEQLAEPDATPEVVSSFLERQVKAGEAIEAHAALRAWLDESEPALKPAKTTTKKKPAKATKAAKKKPAKAAKRR